MSKPCGGTNKVSALSNACPKCGEPMITRRECVEDDLWEIVTRCLDCGIITEWYAQRIPVEEEE